MYLIQQNSLRQQSWKDTVTDSSTISVVDTILAEAAIRRLQEKYSRQWNAIDLGEDSPHLAGFYSWSDGRKESA